MNIAVLTFPPPKFSVVQGMDSTDRSRIMMIVDLMQQAGKRLTGNHNELGCFLISTPDLLRALSEAPPFPAEFGLEVFSLAPPDGQLSGQVNDSNKMERDSYRIGFHKPSPPEAKK